MAHNFLYFTLLALTLVAAIDGIHVVEYVVTNNAASTAGGIKFNDDVGAEYSKHTLISATDFIWRLFHQNSAADRKDVQMISLFIEDIDGVAYASNNEIQVSARYIGGYSGDVKREEITGVLYHENIHIWQWNGNGQTPSWLIEGLVDFVRLKAGYDPSHWVKQGGDKWDQGYDVTARFLDYCNDLSNGVVSELNKKMRTGYNDDFFVELLGKPVDQLWSDYKANYGN